MPGESSCTLIAQRCNSCRRATGPGTPRPCHVKINSVRTHCRRTHWRHSACDSSFVDHRVVHGKVGRRGRLSSATGVLISRVHLLAHHTATATYVNLQPHKTLLALPATLSQDNFYEKVRRYAYWRYRMCFKLWEIFLEALSKQVVHAGQIEVAAKLSVCKGQAYLLSSSSLSTCLVCRIFIWYHLSSAIAGEAVNLVSNIWFYNHSTSMNTFTHYNNHACTTKASSHCHLITHTQARTRGITSRTYSYPLFVLYPKQNKI